MLEVMEYMRRELDLGTLHSMTGLDAVDKYQVLYYLSYNYGIVVTLTTDVGDMVTCWL